MLYIHTTMKKFFLFLTALLSLGNMPFLQASTIDINGNVYPIDTTVEKHQVGPGVWHTRFTIAIGTNKHNCYLMEIDLTNPYNTVEEWQSSNEFGKTQRLADAHVQMNEANHRPVGGVNCNFWVVTSQNKGYNEGLLGQSFAGTARNGMLIGNPDDWNFGHGDRGYVMVDRNKRVHIEEMAFGGGLITQNNDTFPILEVNRTRVNPTANEIVVFNEYTSRNGTRATDGIEVVFSAPEWNINGKMTCTVLSTNTTGGTKLAEGQGVLQGRGTGKTQLETLKIGDTFTMQLGVFGRKDPTFQPDILQMVTGNCLVMRDGVLTDRNTNEDYNNKNYARTMLATNNEGNKLWMLVAENPGMYTAQMCAIVRHAGATYAAGMDGGGSAQMCLEGQVINPTTEGTARAVANSMWVFSTAPDDSVVARLEYPDDKIRLPKYGVFAPSFMSYNQYDVLLSYQQPNVKLTCDESVGYINEDGAFVCLSAGTLTASCDNATKTFEVELEPTTGLDIRLDSVIVMNNTNYLLDVDATAAGKTLPIFAAALTWIVADETIVTITKDGILNGISDGKTYVYGELDGNKDSILVSVEIPQANPLCINTFAGEDATAWAIKASSTSWGTQLVVNETGKAALNFTYAPARKANIELQNNIRFYGLPESISLYLQTDKEILTDVNFKLQANGLDKQTQCKFQNIKVGEQTHALIDIKQEIGNEISIHPIHLEAIQLNLNTATLTKSEQYSIILYGLYLNYGDLSVGVDNVLSQQFAIYPNPTSDQLNICGIQQPTAITLFDLQGRTMATQTLAQDGTLNISHLTAGTYILKVGNETVKIIKQ